MKLFVKLSAICLLCLLLLGVALPTLASGNAEEDKESELPPVVGEISPFGVYVGGIPVTEENMDDILGDVPTDEDATGKNTPAPTPRAVYRERDHELILSGTLTLADATMMGNFSYSILSINQEEPLTVTIAENSILTLLHGVYLLAGSLTAQHATLSFVSALEDGRTSSRTSDAFVRIGEGDIAFRECRVECLSTDSIVERTFTNAESSLPAGVGFAANNIIIERNSRLVVRSEEREHPLYAVLWAREGIEISANSAVQASCLDANGYYADAFLRAGESIRISDANVGIEGVGCAIVLDSADLTIRDHSEVLVTALRGIVTSGSCVIEGSSYVELATSDGGIAVVGEEAYFRAESDTTLRLVYDAWGDDIRNPAHEDFRFVATQPWSTYPEAAFYSEGCPVSFKNTNVTALGHTLGILCRATGDRLSFTGRYDISATVAFFTFAESRDAVSFGTEIRGNAKLSTIQALGGFASALVTHEGTLSVIPGSIGMGSLADVPTTFTGYIGDAHVQSDAFPVAAVVIPCVALVVVSIVIIALYKTGYIFVGRRRKQQDDTPENDTNTEIGDTQDVHD